MPSLQLQQGWNIVFQLVWVLESSICLFLHLFLITWHLHVVFHVNTSQAWRLHPGTLVGSLACHGQADARKMSRFWATAQTVPLCFTSQASCYLAIHLHWRKPAKKQE